MRPAIFSIVLGASMIVAIASAQAAGNKFSGEAILATPVSQPGEKVIKGITWHCEATRCTAVAKQWPGLDSFIKQCRTVASAIGELVAYRNGSRIADRGELATCNRAVGAKA
jgi:hypothetical protein